MDENNLIFVCPGFDLFEKIVAIISATDLIVRFSLWYKNYQTLKIENSDSVSSLFSFLENADFSTGNTPPDDLVSLGLFKDWFNDYFKRSILKVFFHLYSF